MCNGFAILIVLTTAWSGDRERRVAYPSMATCQEAMSHVKVSGGSAAYCEPGETAVSSLWIRNQGPDWLRAVCAEGKQKD